MLCFFFCFFYVFHIHLSFAEHGSKHKNDNRKSRPCANNNFIVRSRFWGIKYVYIYKMQLLIYSVLMLVTRL